MVSTLAGLLEPTIGGALFGALGITQGARGLGEPAGGMIAGTAAFFGNLA